MTREEHLAWCKARAMDYLPHDPIQAWASFASDMNKHEDTFRHPALDLGAMMLLDGHLNDPKEMERFIKGFN